jgi:hypothetical protein
MDEKDVQHEYGVSESEEMPPLSSGKPRRRKGLLLGGIMTLIAGILCMVNGFGSLLGGSTSFVGGDTAPINVTACGAIVVFLGSIAIAGGITAIREKHISLALAGAAAGMMGGGNPGFWLGLASLVLFAFSDVDI